MAIRLGDTAPNFTAETTAGTINFHDYLGDGWGILFSHPRDYTPVCTTELGTVAGLKADFEKRNVKVVGLSIDSIEDHEGWIGDIEDVTGHALNFPLVADPTRDIALSYDMIHPEADNTATVRSVFVIGPDKRVKLTLTYPASTGRNFDEILRIVDSLKRTSENKVATPANWQPGEDVIIVPSLSDEAARDIFPKFETVKPYLRTVPDPI
ncbi:MAG: peroxiredoxin [Myxococcota bacterium]|nr:peroxiredoxin [Myxococcota bacterium]